MSVLPINKQVIMIWVS